MTNTIGQTEIIKCFELGLSCHRGEIRLRDAVNVVVEELSMNEGGAQVYIKTVHSIIESDFHPRMISPLAIEI